MYTYLKTLAFEALEQRKVKKKFYLNNHFKQVDRALLKAYRKANPYQISKNYLKKAGASNLYAYGETPLTTMAQIARECQIGPNDTVIEMGAGRGRAALFLAEFVGCRVLAYEQIPEFVKRMIPSENLTMVAEDMFSAPFSQASVVFLYGTMLADEEIEGLLKKFPRGVKIITVSYPLSDYSEKYKVIKTFSGRFPWGKTEVYWNERIG